MILPRSGGCMDHHWVDGVGQKKSETLRKTRLRVQAGNCTEKAPKKGNISGWGPLAFGSCVGGAVVQCPKKEGKEAHCSSFPPVFAKTLPSASLYWRLPQKSSQVESSF